MSMHFNDVKVKYFMAGLRSQTVRNSDLTERETLHSGVLEFHLKLIIV
jgi:hypothetical protein